MERISDMFKTEPQETEIITAYVKGKKVMLTPSEAVSLINQVSGVLLAYEYNKPSQEQHQGDIRAAQSEAVRPFPGVRGPGYKQG